MNWNKLHIAQFLLLISLFKESLSEDEDDIVRLPNHMVPRNYNLTIIPNFGSRAHTFEGVVVILMTCLNNDSQSITLHATDIKIKSYILSNTEGKNISIKNIEIEEEDDFIIFNLNETLTKSSNYSLFLTYQSTYDYLEGFISYKVLYKKFYYTSLPLMNARRVFPCFDEPEFKATFDLTLARQQHMTTLSNMPHRNISIKKSTKRDLVFDEFQTTPNMSTHVLGFYISDFSNKTAPNTSDVDIKMWASDDLLADDNKILQKVGGIYNGLQQYLNFTQPMNKQDLVLVHYDKKKGADSWGIINFASYQMYIGNKSLPHSNEENLITLAYKLSHQWFGNLVTPSWWNYLWLNEGPSTFMSYFVLRGEINKIWDMFNFDIFQNILKQDSSPKTHPLKYEDDLYYMDVSILSEKGACIIRMMVSTFGEDVFQKGIEDYLKKFSFKNVDQDDLWSSIQKSVNNTNISVKNIMDGWTTKKGYPLVTLNISEVCKNMHISQQQFFSYKKEELEELEDEELVEDTEQFWKIPFTYQVINIDNDTVVGNMSKLINETASTNISDTLIMNNTLVIANVETNGYFRVNYDKDNWNKIIQLLRRNHTVIHVLNRAQFMDDAFSFVRPEIEEYTLGMKISTYLLKEKEELPWLTFFEYLKNFYNKIILNNRNSTFMSYLKNITSDIYNPFNQTVLESETSGLGFELRIQANKWACLSGNEECNSWAIEAFEEWRNLIKKGIKLNKTYVDEYLLTIACSKLINNTDNDTLIFVLNQIKSRNRLQDAISCIEKEQQIRFLLNKYKSKLQIYINALSWNYYGRGVIREVLQNITDSFGNLLSPIRIYYILTDNLKRSATKEEFNKTTYVFEDIVNWPQFERTPDPTFKLKAIQEHIQKINKTWAELKGIEDKVISVVLNP